MNPKLKKIDAVIIAILILISGIVLFRAEIFPNPEQEPPVIRFRQDEDNRRLIVTYVSQEVKWSEIDITGNCDQSKLGERVIDGDIITNCYGTIKISHFPTDTDYGPWTFKREITPPESLIPAEFRTVSPRDEGPHYKNKLLVNREWWYYTVIFDGNSPLAGWTATISFNHMSRDDLFVTKPDLLFVILQNPEGKKYGGIVEKKRPLLGDYAFLEDPILQVSSSDKMLKITYGDSYVSGSNPNWYVHIEKNEEEGIDVSMDLNFKANSPAYWTYSSRLIDNSKSSVASYIFMGCEVTGTVNIGYKDIEVRGIGHHEHTWISGLLTSGLIRGWDWCHMKFDNGWNIYYSNYYFSSQLKPEKTYKINPFANIVVTKDKGNKITILENIKVEITDSDKLFLLKNMPNKISIEAEPNPAQLGLKGTNTKLKLNIDLENAFENEWKRFARVGMKIGRSEINGIMTWKDNDGSYQVKLEGIGTTWNMRH